MADELPCRASATERRATVMKGYSRKESIDVGWYDSLAWGTQSCTRWKHLSYSCGLNEALVLSRRRIGRTSVKTSRFIESIQTRSGQSMAIELQKLSIQTEFILSAS